MTEVMVYEELPTRYHLAPPAIVMNTSLHHKIQVNPVVDCPLNPAHSGVIKITTVKYSFRRQVVRIGCRFHARANSCKALLIFSKRHYGAQKDHFHQQHSAHQWLPYSEIENGMVSPHNDITSRQRRSILWLCVEEPAMWLPRPAPRCNHKIEQTSTFSPPLSDRTRDGAPNSCVAFNKKEK